MKFASLFTGMGGCDIGAMQAGLTPVWGIEKDPIIACTVSDNLKKTVFIGDINSIDISRFPDHLDKPDWLHASPPCINASRAKNGKETQEDIDLADAICRAIAALRPKYFSLENVTGYLSFKSFAIIKNCLYRLGYWGQSKVFDCADHGVPQSRKRLFLVASKDESAYNIDKIKTSPVVSWKEAIADLIPSLKPTTLTNWQCNAISDNDKYFNPDHTMRDLAIQRSGARKKDGIPNNTIRLANEPMFTIKAMSGNIRTSVNQVTIIIDGQPYQADERCLARWQTIPDWYQFSDDHWLNVKMIGNAVPPLMMQKIIESVIQ